MLRLLLDEHLAPAIATRLRKQCPDLEVTALLGWENGSYLGASDATLLTAAHGLGWTLVTYDLRTIAPLLKEWGETGTSHGGVILVDERTLASIDIGGLVHSLSSLWEEMRGLDWENRIVFLSRPAGDR